MQRHKARLAFWSLFAGLAAGGFVEGAGAQVSAPEAVEVQPLSKDAFSTGTLSAEEGALPPTLWRESDAQTLEFLLANLPARLAAPSLGAAMKRTLLSPGAGPPDAGASLDGKKLLALGRAGFIDEARAVASLSLARRGDPWMAQARAHADLLDGDIAEACQRGASLTSGREADFWVRLRVLCYAESGERDAADLTLGLLRDKGGLDESDAAFLTAVVAGAAPQPAPKIKSALHYAIARKIESTLSLESLAEAEGGVLAALAGDLSNDFAIRIDAGERAVAMGVMDASDLAALMQSIALEPAQIANAREAVATRAHDPLTDAILFHSIQAMNAPEFLRDKAQRIAQALGLADRFYRAYALSLLYADEIATLEGVLVAPSEAAEFAMARMAVGDSAGAALWLGAMIGRNESISALPEPQARAFMDRVNLLAVLDPQTAAQIARAGNISLLAGDPGRPAAASAHDDPAITARILESAFDAALDGKLGQAGLSALAASGGAAPGGDVESVLIGQSLRAAGMSDLSRRYAFERAWASSYPDAGPSAAQTAPEDGSFPRPRLKPRGDR